MCCVYTQCVSVCVCVYGLLSESFVVDVLSDNSRETHISFTWEVCVCGHVCMCVWKELGNNNYYHNEKIIKNIIIVQSSFKS